jgi:hypothetical protein
MACCILLGIFGNFEPIIVQKKLVPQLVAEDESQQCASTETEMIEILLIYM